MHKHHWLISKEEGGYRCVSGCKGFLPAKFLFTVDRSIGLDGAWDAYTATLKAERSEAVNSHSTPALKTCTVCEEDKPRDQFHKRKASADGLQSRCKPCNVAAVLHSRKVNSQKTDSDS